MIMIFIDGLGLGAPAPQTNPVFAAGLPELRKIIGEVSLTTLSEVYIGDDVTIAPADAAMGVEGLPQSATGQAAIFTGINVAAILNGHVSGFPTKTIRDILQKNNLFSALREKGKRVCFANTYTPEYFSLLKDRQDFVSVTTVCAMAAEIKLNSISDLLEGKSLYHDLTNELLRKKGHEVNLITYEQAGRILAGLSKEYDFVFFEYFLTDWAGHAQDMEMAKEIISGLDQFIYTVAKSVELDKTQIVVTSDHGNIEDLSVNMHTKNKVPVMAMGKLHKAWTEVKNLTDIMPKVLSLLSSYSQV